MYTIRFWDCNVQTVSARAAYEVYSLLKAEGIHVTLYISATPVLEANATY